MKHDAQCDPAPPGCCPTVRAQRRAATLIEPAVQRPTLCRWWGHSRPALAGMYHHHEEAAE